MFKNNYSELEKTIPFKQIDFPFCCFRRQFRPRKELILDVKFDSLFLQIQLPHLTQLVTNDYLFKNRTLKVSALSTGLKKVQALTRQKIEHWASKSSTILSKKDIFFLCYELQSRARLKKQKGKCDGHGSVCIENR